MKKAEYLTPVVTIFDRVGNIDQRGNEMVYDFLIKGGVDGIVVMGSTGEFFAMSMEQKKRLIDIAVPYIKGRVKCMIGTGCMSVRDTVELSNYACDAGADAVMIVCPFYFPLSDEDIEAYYDTILPQIRGNVFIYNYPGATGDDVTPEITLRLLHKHKNLVGYKDTIELFSHTRKLIEVTKEEYPDFIIYSGYDENLVHIMLSGGNGCIGGLSNFAPKLCSEWCRAINEKNWEYMFDCQEKINGLMYIYSSKTPFPQIAKKALNLQGVPVSEYCMHFSQRPPTVKKLQAFIDGIDLENLMKKNTKAQPAKKAGPFIAAMNEPAYISFYI